MKKGATRPSPKRLRKKHVISPAVSDNLWEIEEVSEEEEDEEETLVARSRRVLSKITFDGARGVDEEETDSDEVIGKGERIKRRRQKQEEQLEENPSDRVSGSDVATSTGDEKDTRLTIPHSKMVVRYADVLLGSSSRGARRYLSSLPPSHELALMMRNVAELSALSVHSLRRSLRQDAIRRRYRKKIRGVQAENDHLKAELTSEKKRLTELATAALQLKADMARISNEK
ncbi:hypothetical protein Dimus_022315 [Dionaea muscipula]